MILSLTPPHDLAVGIMHSPNMDFPSGFMVPPVGSATPPHDLGAGIMHSPSIDLVPGPKKKKNERTHKKVSDHSETFHWFCKTQTTHVDKNSPASC